MRDLTRGERSRAIWRTPFYRLQLLLYAGFLSSTILLQVTLPELPVPLLVMECVWGLLLVGTELAPVLHPNMRPLPRLVYAELHRLIHEAPPSQYLLAPCGHLVAARPWHDGGVVMVVHLNEFRREHRQVTIFRVQLGGIAKVSHLSPNDDVSWGEDGSPQVPMTETRPSWRDVALLLAHMRTAKPWAPA